MQINNIINRKIRVSHVLQGIIYLVYKLLSTK